MSRWIGITLGDVTGIGPEVTLKALSQQPNDPSCRLVIIGDHGVLEKTSRQLGLSLNLVSGRLGDAVPDGSVLVFQPGNGLPEFLKPGSPLASEAALSWLRIGAEHCLSNDLAGLVTAPVSKESIIRAGVSPSFVGQTEFLSDLSSTTRTAMMLVGRDEQNRWLRVVLVTTHLPLKLVPASLTEEKIVRTIELASQACSDLGLEKARIGVCGLNPHAGEGGELGREDIEVIGPAVEKAIQAGCTARGPLSADTLFHQAFRGDFEVVVAMYHDQGLVPLKMIGFETGVNWTLGLPFTRTSPDHGTAFDIAGKGVASPESMKSAIKLAKNLTRQRKAA